MIDEENIFQLKMFPPQNKRGIDGSWYSPHFHYFTYIYFTINKLIQLVSIVKSIIYHVYIRLTLKKKKKKYFSI